MCKIVFSQHEKVKYSCVCDFRETQRLEADGLFSSSTHFHVFQFYSRTLLYIGHFCNLLVIWVFTFFITKKLSDFVTKVNLEHWGCELGALCTRYAPLTVSWNIAGSIWALLQTCWQPDLWRLHHYILKCILGYLASPHYHQFIVIDYLGSTCLD